ncbi:hypothetical protein DWU95_38715, partial [Burkholderia contaminans]
MTYNPFLLIVRPNLDMSEPLLPPIPDAHDLVSELLLGMRLSGVQSRPIQVARPFRLYLAPGPGPAPFQFLPRGPGWLLAPPRAPRR